jgi:hypothetical protein
MRRGALVWLMLPLAAAPRPARAASEGFDFCPGAGRCDECLQLAREHERRAFLEEGSHSYAAMRAAALARVRAAFYSADGLLLSMSEAATDAVPNAGKPRAASVLRWDLPVCPFGRGVSAGGARGRGESIVVPAPPPPRSAARACLLPPLRGSADVRSQTFFSNATHALSSLSLSLVRLTCPTSNLLSLSLTHTLSLSLSLRVRLPMLDLVGVVVVLLLLAARTAAGWLFADVVRHAHAGFPTFRMDCGCSPWVPKTLRGVAKRRFGTGGVGNSGGAPLVIASVGC